MTTDKDDYIVTYSYGRVLRQSARSIMETFGYGQVMYDSSNWPVKTTGDLIRGTDDGAIVLVWMDRESSIDDDGRHTIASIRRA